MIDSTADSALPDDEDDETRQCDAADGRRQDESETRHPGVSEEDAGRHQERDESEPGDAPANRPELRELTARLGKPCLVALSDDCPVPGRDCPTHVSTVPPPVPDSDYAPRCSHKVNDPDPRGGTRRSPVLRAAVLPGCTLPRPP